MPGSIATGNAASALGRDSNEKEVELFFGADVQLVTPSRFDDTISPHEVHRNHQTWGYHDLL